ncbi:MAG: ImmA/IrrE family metallo-endopeptidase, partial [bacterium]
MARLLWQEEAELDLRRRMDEVVANMNEIGCQVIYSDALKTGMGGIKRRKGRLFCLINKNLPLTAQFFTLLHEYEHAQDMSQPDTLEEERRINRKVAAHLISADELADLPEIYDADELVTVLEEKAIRLGVSFSTLCYAQQEQGRISRQTCEMLVA